MYSEMCDVLLRLGLIFKVIVLVGPDKHFEVIHFLVGQRQQQSFYFFYFCEHFNHLR